MRISVSALYSPIDFCKCQMMLQTIIIPAIVCFITGQRLFCILKKKYVELININKEFQTPSTLREQMVAINSDSSCKCI